MKKAILALLIIVFIPMFSFAYSLEPPKRDCKPDEVNRCEIKSCTSDLVYHPIIFEDGKAVGNFNSDSKCDWTCVCVKKKSEIN